MSQSIYFTSGTATLAPWTTGTTVALPSAVTVTTGPDEETISLVGWLAGLLAERHPEHPEYVSGCDVCDALAEAANLAPE